MQVLVVCPAKFATGGTEALHYFTNQLNQIDGVDAYMWYWGDTSGDPCADAFKGYGCKYVKELPDDFDGVIVFPEIWANETLRHTGCTRAIWWLGIDAYANWTAPGECGAFLDDDSIIHLAQSEYALDFLRKVGCKQIFKLDDIVNPDYYADYQEETRNNVVLYNPAKATQFMAKIIAACPGVEFKPITNMTRAQVIDTMRHSKLYIDFGEFPGRERMPREAALCGCCLITSKIGAAAYLKDFAHDYKYDMKDGHVWAIVRKIRYVLDNYDECKKDFDTFRDSLREDIQRIPKQVKQITGVFNEVQHNHSGI